MKLSIFGEDEKIYLRYLDSVDTEVIKTKTLLLL